MQRNNDLASSGIALAPAPASARPGEVKSLARVAFEAYWASVSESIGIHPEQAKRLQNWKPFWGPEEARFQRVADAVEIEVMRRSDMNYPLLVGRDTPHEAAQPTEAK